VSVISSIVSLSITDTAKLSLDKLTSIKAQSDAFKVILEKANSYKLTNTDSKQSREATIQVRENIYNNMIVAKLISEGKFSGDTSNFESLASLMDSLGLTKAQQATYRIFAEKEFNREMSNPEYKERFLSEAENQYKENYTDTLRGKLIKTLQKSKSNLLGTQIKAARLHEKLKELSAENDKVIIEFNNKVLAVRYFIDQSKVYFEQYRQYLLDAYYNENGEITVTVNGKDVKKNRDRLMKDMLEELSISKLYGAIVDTNKELGKLNLQNKTIKNEIHKLEGPLFGHNSKDTKMKELAGNLKANLEQRIDEEIVARQNRNRAKHKE
jgi:sulfur carrier protein ThiS